MKDWIKEAGLGLILFLVGVGLTWYWLGEVILIIKGLIGPILLILGLILLWVGYEDKKIEKELKEIEKELEKEENKQQSQENKQ
jgi:sensor histidine kinase YesM